MPIKATFTGDVTDLRRGTQQAREEFRKVGTEAEGAARQLKAVGSSFDGSRLEGAARRAATSIERIGGVARLTDSEIAKNSRTVSELLQKYERMGVEAPANIRKLASELQQAAGAARQLDTATSGLGDKLKSGFGALTSGLGIGLGAGAGLGAITAIGGALRDMAAEGARMGPLSQAFERLQGGAMAASQELQKMQTATRGLVSETDLMRQSNQASQLNLTAMGVEMSKLAGAAVTLGRAVGNDATQSIDDLIGALGRGSTEVLDNLGITLRLSEAHTIYAARIGKTVEQLTDQEKKQAFVTIGMERAIEAANRLGEVHLTVAEQAERIATALGDMGARMFSAGNQATTLATELGKVADVLDRIRNARLGDLGNVLARELDRAGQSLNASIKKTIENLPWYWQGLATTGMFPAALAANAMQATAPLIGNTDPFTAAMFPTMASHGGRPAQAPGGGGSAAGAAATITKISDAQRELNAETAKAFKFSQDAARGWEEYAGALQLTEMEMAAVIDMQQKAIMDSRRGGSTSALMMTGPYQYQISSNMTGGVLNGTRQIAEATKDWRVEVRGVAQAFAQLAQIAGPSLNGVTRGIGTVFASADAASQLVESLSGMVGGLGATDAQGDFQMSGAGRALSGGLAGLGIGLQVGQLGLGRGTSFLAGAASGAATGGLAGGWVGAGAGALIGGFAALYSGDANRRAQAQAIQQQREQIVASMGGIDEFRRAVERTGEAYGRFLNEFLSSDVDVFTGAVNRLNRALTTQQAAATSLAKALASVSSVQGVLSREQLQQLYDVGRRGGPGSEAIVEFAQQQRAQAEGGIAAAIAALDTATAGGTQNMADFDASIGAVTASLVVLFNTAIQDGESAVSVLQRLATPIQTLQRLLAAAGQAPGAGFAQLSVLTDIATGAQTGPLVALAQGLGQALAGFANTGLLSPELFEELANGIGEAYHQLELLGKGGLEAARLMQPSLQAIWQMIQANPALRDQLDATTLALLEFAEQNGLVGEKFRPAIDRMITALDNLIKRIGDLIDAIAGVPPIEVPVTYVPGEMPAPPPAPGTPGGPPSGHQPSPIDPITPFAAGGIVTRPTRALIGEAGPEAVIPLSRLGRMGAPIQITVVSQIDGYEAARAITRYQPDVYRTYGAA